MTRVLVVDDERGIADSLQAILELFGYESSAVYSAEEALALMPGFQPHLVISDVMMLGMTGLDLASELQTRYPDTFIILLSGNAGTEDLLAESGDHVKSLKILAKPIAPRELLRIVAEMTNSKDAA